jgi:hypothetical protein
MIQVAKIGALLLLLINGVGAVYGGYNLMKYPDGSSLHISLAYLAHSPFRDFFFPGLILLWANGVFSFVALAGLVFQYRHHAWLIMAQGIVLLGWIAIQMMMLRTIDGLHIIFITIGILLIGLGWTLMKKS